VGLQSGFYREELFETALGFKGLENFMVNFSEKWAIPFTPHHASDITHD
jgi:hypothetical protein